MRLASLSQRFFSKGEEQEANGYQNVVLEPDDALSAPDLEFDSFDKIPRRRRPLLTITALLVSLPAVGYVAWKSTRGLGAGGSSVTESAQAMVGGEPAAAAPSLPPTQAGGPPSGGLGAPANGAPSEPPVVLSGTCPTPAPPAAAAAAAPAPEDDQAREAAPEPTRKAQPVAAASPSITAPPTAEPGPVKRTASAASKKAEAEAEAPAAETASPRPAARPRPSGSALHGYVWSPEANALVPATEPAPADPVTSEPSRAPSEPAAAPPVEGFKVAPAPPVAAPAERPAPPPPEQAAPIIE
jgi:hypothetical protein